MIITFGLVLIEQKTLEEAIDDLCVTKEISEIVAREQILRDEIDKIIAEIEV